MQHSGIETYIKDAVIEDFEALVKKMVWEISLSRYQGHIGTYLIMGGVDVTGPHLYEIAAHGSTSKVNQ